MYSNKLVIFELKWRENEKNQSKISSSMFFVFCQELLKQIENKKWIILFSNVGLSWVKYAMLVDWSSDIATTVNRGWAKYIPWISCGFAYQYTVVLNYSPTDFLCIVLAFEL